MIIDEKIPQKIQSTQDMIDQIDEDFELPLPSEKKEVYSSLNTAIKETQESEIKYLNTQKEKKENKDLINKTPPMNTQETSSIISSITEIKDSKEINEKENLDCNKEISNINLGKDDDIITTRIEPEKGVDINKIKNKIELKRESMHSVKEFKLYYHNTDLYMIKMAKFDEDKIIFMCYELKLEKDPNFFYYNLYTQEDLVNICKVFLLIQKRDKLFKVFSNIFNNNNVKLSKDVCDKNSIKLNIKLILPDGDETNISLILYRKDRKENEAFYDHYIGYERQQRKEKEKEKKKITESWGEDDTTIYNYEVGINFDTQIDDGSLKRSYMSKYVNKNFKNKTWKKHGMGFDDVSEVNNEDLIKEEEEEKKEEQEDEEIKKRMKWNKNLSQDTLLKLFNKKYKSTLKIEDKEINLFEKGVLTEGITRLSQIQFPNVLKLYLGCNSIYRLDDLPNSTFDQLQILSLHDNNIQDLAPLGRCKFLPFLKELYLYNNKIETLDGLSGAEFKELSILHLFNNNLTDIKAFKTIKFEKISKLLLYNNKIESIDSFAECNFKTLKSLIIYNNKITSVDSFAKCNLENLNEIIINRNKITSIEPLAKCNFSNMGTFLFHNNNITSAEPLEKTQFGNLRIFYIYGNKLAKINKRNQEIMNNIKKKNKRIIALKW